MKLRTRSSSIRLRLTRSEVAALARDGRVAESIVFGVRPSDTFTYTLVLSETAPAVVARLEGAHVIVEVPAEVGRTWAASEEVGIQANVDVGGGVSLGVLIEKDFACLAPRIGEDDSDAYDHPGAAGGTC